ncbi:GtrA family protein [Peribacillus deserti]|uniref:Polysaccharide biosynthesis protein GtrA n=1 Tax=Peribacillus deserti TaxID=673318 RepID=A0A2N5M888_9BACI|nr:GtrA family protein [Peribacillus deserti]PLT30574.1 polysaccharide biosynthesis protein GtrA [Peribacillus deserti]
MNRIPLILKKCQTVNSPFLRFLIVGVLNTVIGLSSIFILMNVFGIGYWYSTLIGNVIGASASFFLNRAFTFKSSVSYGKSAFKFAGVIAISYFLSYSASGVVAENLRSMMGSPRPDVVQNAAVLIGSFLYTILNYTGQKYLVFYRRVQEL